MSTYKLNNTLLGKCAAEKDLGVWITNDLTWSKHVLEKSARANKLLGYIKRITRFILGTAVRRTLFLGLVQCNLPLFVTTNTASLLWYRLHSTAIPPALLETNGLNIACFTCSTLGSAVG